MINSYDEMPIGVMQQILDINGTHMSDDEKTFRVAALLAGIDYEDFLNLSLDDARKIVSQSGWIETPPQKTKKVKKWYVLNGKQYRLQADVENMTTAQYIDFQSIHREDIFPVLGELIAIVLIPKGCTYNDGYEHSDAVGDINNYLSVTEGLAIADFFTRRFVKSMRRLFKRANRLLTAAMVTAKGEQKELIQAAQIQSKLIQNELVSELGLD